MEQVEERRALTAKDRTYMKRLAQRGVPHMAIYYRMRESGVDIKEHHLRDLPSPRFREGELRDYSIRMRPDVMEAMRAIAKDLGYVFYTSRGEVGMLPPFFEAIVAGQIELVVLGDEDELEPENLTMRDYTLPLPF